MPYPEYQPTPEREPPSLFELRRTVAQHLQIIHTPWAVYLEIPITRAEEARYISLIALHIFDAFAGGELLTKTNILTILETQHNTTAQKYLDMFRKAELITIKTAEADRRRSYIIPTTKFISRMKSYIGPTPIQTHELLDLPEAYLLNPEEHLFVHAIALRVLEIATLTLCASEDQAPGYVYSALASIVLGHLTNARAILDNLAEKNPEYPERQYLEDLYQKRSRPHASTQQKITERMRASTSKAMPRTREDIARDTLTAILETSKSQDRP